MLCHKICCLHPSDSSLRIPSSDVGQHTLSLHFQGWLCAPGDDLWQILGRDQENLSGIEKRVLGRTIRFAVCLKMSAPITNEHF